MRTLAAPMAVKPSIRACTSMGCVLMLLSGSNSTRLGLSTTFLPRTSTLVLRQQRGEPCRRESGRKPERGPPKPATESCGASWLQPAAAAIPAVAAEAVNHSRLVSFPSIRSTPERLGIAPPISPEGPGTHPESCGTPPAEGAQYSAGNWLCAIKPSRSQFRASAERQSLRNRFATSMAASTLANERRARPPGPRRSSPDKGRRPDPLLQPPSRHERTSRNLPPSVHAVAQSPARDSAASLCRAPGSPALWALPRRPCPAPRASPERRRSWSCRAATAAAGSGLWCPPRWCR